MTDLKEVGIVPGNEVEILSVVGANKPIEVRGQSGTAELTSSIAHAVMVTAK
jgi:DtxR family Mn-dependent transcriptional regulator